MERIIDTLLAVAREEATPRHGTADAHEAAVRAAELCGDVAATRGVTVEVSRSGGSPRIAADRDMVERILVPVIENACRYGTKRVTVTTSGGRDGTVTYVVSDDGPGVTAADAGRIFEPGVRGSAGSGNGAADGAGLGLALARRLARAANGDVEAHVGSRGGRFTVVLPSA
jgi:signal transduction histidine kinase